MTAAEVERILMTASPKVIAMYEAVNQLIMEGADINGLKVSDITKKAGIGKGTAYEYFNTKEELVSKAIFFQMRGSLQSMMMLVERGETLRDKIYVLLEHMEQNHSWYRVLSKYLCYYIQGLLDKETMVSGLEQCAKENEELRGFFCHLMETARAEGIISREIPYHFIGNAVITQTIGYNMHIGGSFGAAEIEAGVMKQFVYHNIVRSIRDAELLTGR